MDPVEGILCVEYLLNKDNALKDDVVLGQIVTLVPVGDVPCELVENPKHPFCRCQVFPPLKTVILFS